MRRPVPDSGDSDPGDSNLGDPDLLGLAFDLAAGLPPEGAPPSARVPADLLAFARRVVAAGRRALEAPAVPSAVLRRAADRFDDRVSRPARGAGARGVEGIPRWKLLFDSFARAVPGAGRLAAAGAMRGAARARFLRYEGGEASLDVEMVVGEAGTLGVRGTADGVPRGATLRLVPRKGRAVLVVLRAGGAFAATLPPGAGSFTIEVRCGRRSLGTTPRIPPPAA